MVFIFEGILTLPSLHRWNQLREQPHSRDGRTGKTSPTRGPPISFLCHAMLYASGRGGAQPCPRQNHLGCPSSRSSWVQEPHGSLGMTKKNQSKIKIKIKSATLV